MLALIYLIVMVALGDLICRRIFSFYSIQHRLATAFLSGLLFCTCATYIFALLAAKSPDPLLWANILFFAVSMIVLILVRRLPPCGDQPGDGSLGFIRNRLKASYGRSGNSEDDHSMINSAKLHNPIRFDAPDRPPGDGKWDWLFLAACLIFGGWLFFATLDYSNGSFEFAVKSWSDFGANLSLSQSFAVGHNYPTEHPFFPGEAIRYHFLFWFQAANLSYLGLNLVWGVNLLSLISLASLLVLIITFAELLFNSRAVARIAAALFFFASSSLAFIPFLLSQSSVAAAINSILNLKDFVRSGFPFRGDDWGGLTVAVFSNQRHLISSAGILLIVIIYLIGFYRRKGTFVPVHNSDTLQSPTEVGGFAEANLSKKKPSFADFRVEAPALLFCGILIGLMPYWNSAVFLSAAIILASLFVLFPFRRYLVVMIGTVILFGLPQILMLRSGSLAPAGDSFFQWGYTIPNPTLWIVLGYLGWTFGVRWLLLLVAVFFVPSAHRKLLLGLLSLVFVVFLFQLSTDAFNNHKLLNIWTVLSSVYVAYALWLIGRRGILRRSLAIFLTLVLTLGAVIDLFPLHNDGFVSVPYENDRLTEWLLNNTQPSDIFLTDTLLSHPILFTGRKIFLGNTLFAWTAGYELKDRESTYRRMLMERDPAMLLDLMHKNKISFVAIDDGLRSNKSINGMNEAVIRKYFEIVYEDDEHRQGNITIYKVPPSATGGQSDEKGEVVDGENNLGPALSLWDGGTGQALGQFDRPRGIAVDEFGDTYIADTMNGRIQKFSTSGEFQMFIGSSDKSEFEFKEPNGIAVARKGNIYVADALTQRVLEFDTNGRFIKQWIGPEPGFLGPRSLAWGENNLLYIVDQGHARIVAIDTDSEATFEWGMSGDGDGEFREPTGIEVSGDRVYVADNGNNRVQVFDLSGKFLAQWPIAEWDRYPWQYPDIIATGKNERVYVTNPRDREILVFNSEGKRLETLKPQGLDAFSNPSAIALSNTNAGRRLLILDTGLSKVVPFELDRN